MPFWGARGSAITYFILALKANQDGLFQQVMNCVEENISDDFARLPSERLEESSKKAHGRTDSRTYLQFEVPNAFTGTSRWKGLKTIGVVVYTSLIKGEERIDIRYFISSLPLGIEQFSKAVRRHWGIETTCHWSLDVTYVYRVRWKWRLLDLQMQFLRSFAIVFSFKRPGTVISDCLDVTKKETALAAANAKQCMKKDVGVVQRMEGESVRGRSSLIQK